MGGQLSSTVTDRGSSYPPVSLCSTRTGFLTSHCPCRHLPPQRQRWQRRGWRRRSRVVELSPRSLVGKTGPGVPWEPQRVDRAERLGVRGSMLGPSPPADQCATGIRPSLSSPTARRLDDGYAPSKAFWVRELDGFGSHDLRGQHRRRSRDSARKKGDF